MAISVFLSYRRSDASAEAGRLYDALRRRLRGGSVFMDVDSLRPGQDWMDAVEGAVGRSDALLALIGPDWVGARRTTGDRRLDDPFDPVRLEIEAALKLGKPVIPIMLGDTELPKSSELPASLAPLVRRHAIRLSHETFAADMGPLVRALRVIEENAQPAAATEAARVVAQAPRRVASAAARLNTLPPAPPTPAKRQNVRWALGAALIALILIAGGFAAKGYFDGAAGAGPTQTPFLISDPLSPTDVPSAVSPTAWASGQPTPIPTPVFSVPLFTDSPMPTATQTEVPTRTHRPPQSEPPTKPPKTPKPPTPAPATPTAPPSQIAAHFTSPSPGSQLASDVVTFEWNSVANAKYYAVYVGTQPPPDPNDAYAHTEIGEDSGIPPTRTSSTFSGLPTDGSIIYVRLFTKFEPNSGPLKWRDYIFQAASGS